MTIADHNDDRLSTLAAARDAKPPADDGRALLGLLLWLGRLERDPAVRADPPALAGHFEATRWIDRFRLDGLLGAGAFGVVFQAWDSQLARVVALKIPWPGVLADPELSRRFIGESRAMAAIDHPGIVTVFDAAECNGVSYIAQERIDGPSLAQWMRSVGERPTRLAARIVRSLAETLHAAHEAGIVHRDVKPANVLLRRRQDSADWPFELLLTDFGLARGPHRGTDSTLTATAAIIGTDPYMSPEQAAGRNEEVGPHSDIFSLGVILYELLANQRPFDGENGDQIRQRIIAHEPESLRRRRRGVPQDLETIVGKCLEKDPQRRYPTACELAEDLERFLDRRPIHARRASRARRAARWVQRRPRAAAFAAALVMGGAAIFGLASAWALDRWTAAQRVESAEEAAATADRLSRRHEYVMGIQAAAEALDRGRRDDVRRRLDRCRAAAGGVEDCGVEWRLIESRIHEFDRSLDAHPQGVASVRFCPSGQRLYSAGKEGRVVVWSVGDWDVVHEIAVGTDEVHFAEPSADGSLLAIGCEHGRVVVLRTDDWSTVRDQQAWDGRVFALAWAGAAQLAVGGEGSVVRLIDVGAGTVRSSERLSMRSDEADRSTIVVEEVESLAYDPEHSLLFVGARPYLYFALDASSLRVVDKELHPYYGGGTAAIVPAETTHVAWGCDDAIRIRSATDAQPLWTLPVSGPARSLACSKTGGILVAGCRDGALECWQLAEIARDGERAHRRLMGHDVRALSVDVSPDLTWIASGGDDGRLLLWDLPGNAQRFDTQFAGTLKTVKFSPCGKRLAVVEGREGGALNLLLYDATTGRLIWTAALGELSAWLSVLATQHGPWPVAFSPDANEVVVMDADTVARVRRLETGAVVAEFATGGTQLVTRLQYSPHGESVMLKRYRGACQVIGRRDATIRALHSTPDSEWLGSARTILGDVWLDQPATHEIVLRRGETFEAVQALPGPISGRAPAAVSASADGRWLAVAGDEGVLHCWDLANGGRLTRLVGPAAAIQDVAFSPDARSALSLGEDGQLRIWDLETGAPMMSLGTPDEPIVAMALNPTGETLVLAVKQAGQYGLMVHRLGPPRKTGARRFEPPTRFERLDAEPAK